MAERTGEPGSGCSDRRHLEYGFVAGDQVTAGRQRAGAEPQETGRLLVRTVAVPDPGDLLERIPQPDVVAWVHHGAGLAGWGEAVRVTLPAGEDRFTAGEKWLRSVFDAADVDDQVRVRGSGPVAFGTFTFDASSDGSVLIVPRVVLGRDGRGQAWLTQGDRAGRPPPWGAAPQTALRGRPAAGAALAGGQSGRGAWEEAVAEAVAAIKAGGLRKVVLARDVFGTAAEPIDARVLLGRLATRYPDCFTFACDGMIGATPELLVRREGREVSALVLGGTCRAARTRPRRGAWCRTAGLGQEQRGTRLRGRLDTRCAPAAVRDARGRCASGVAEVPEPAASRHPGPRHADRRRDTEISAGPGRGHAPAGRRLRDPDRRRARVHPRARAHGPGAFAGPVGWMDAEGNGEWGIAIRCAQLSGRTARLFAGCGIVAGSQPAAELAETLVKLQPMRGALEGRGWYPPRSDQMIFIPNGPGSCPSPDPLGR